MNGAVRVFGLLGPVAAVIVVAISAGIFPGVALADEAIWIVDMQRVLDKSIAGKAVRSDMEAEAKKREAKLHVVRAEIERSHRELEKQSALLSAQARESRREEILKRERELAREAQDAQEELQRQTQNRLAKVVDDIRGVVGEISKHDDRKLVLERDPRVVLYVSPEFDLTDEVIKSMDKRTIN